MQIKETVRKDGLRVITVEMPSARRIRMSVACMYGSMYDPKRQEGIAHYMEHMAFKGTTTRNVDVLNDITSRYLMNTNAVTYKTMVEYYSFAVYTRLDELTSFLCDIYLNSTYPEEEFRREKQTILLERARRRDSDDLTGYKAAAKELWPDHPMAADPVGSEQSLKSITRQDLLSLKSKWHVPHNTVIVAGGRIKHAEVLKKLAKYFPEKKNSVVLTHKHLPDIWARAPKRRHIVIKRPKREKAIVMMLAKVPREATEKEKTIHDILGSMIMNARNSRFWKEIREKRGLAYTTGGGIDYEDQLARYIYCRTETGPDKVKEVEHLMRECLVKPLVEQDAFTAAKEKMRDYLALEDDNSPGFWVSEIWECIDERKPLSSLKGIFEKRRKILDSISLEEVERYRAKYFVEKRFITVVVRPT